MAQRDYTHKPMEADHTPSRTSYVHDKCRCEGCRKANAEYKRNKTGDHRAATASTNAALNAAGIPFADPKLTHGLPSTYEWYGCRCDKCTAAHSTREREYRLVKTFEDMCEEADTNTVPILN